MISLLQNSQMVALQTDKTNRIFVISFAKYKHQMLEILREDAELVGIARVLEVSNVSELLLEEVTPFLSPLKHHFVKWDILFS